MVSVLQVYTALKDLANKEQKGFITPQVFNSFAALAQMNIYNEMFSELVDAKRLADRTLILVETNLFESKEKKTSLFSTEERWVLHQTA